MDNRERRELLRMRDELHTVMEASGAYFWHFYGSNVARDMAGQTWVRTSRAVRTLNALLEQDRSEADGQTTVPH